MEEYVKVHILVELDEKNCPMQDTKFCHASVWNYAPLFDVEAFEHWHSLRDALFKKKRQQKFYDTICLIRHVITFEIYVHGIISGRNVIYSELHL